jgi:hypothetical protein
MKTTVRVMIHCAVAVAVAAYGQTAGETKGAGALPQSTAAFHAVEGRNPLHRLGSTSDHLKVCSSRPVSDGRRHYPPDWFSGVSWKKR